LRGLQNLKLEIHLHFKLADKNFWNCVQIMFFSQFISAHLFGRSKMNSKSITPIDSSNIVLPAELEEMAKKKFGETSEIRNHSLQLLRDWIEKNPRINKIRLDTIWLLKFLRIKKFNLADTEDAIERYLLLKNYENCDDKIFRNLEVRNDALQDLLDEG
jgi:hypothetical protein